MWTGLGLELSGRWDGGCSLPGTSLSRSKGEGCVADLRNSGQTAALVVIKVPAAVYEALNLCWACQFIDITPIVLTASL